eukprot:jgi/Tetstr1/454014/TSEL_040933.t1
MVSEVQPPEFELHENLKSGNEDKVYFDRDFKYVDVAGLEGCRHLRTGNDDKWHKRKTSFSVGAASLVFVLFDKLASSLPTWLQHAKWTDTGLVVTTTDGLRRVLAAIYPPGDVKLGTNEEKTTRAKSMYTVLVKTIGTPAPTSSSPAPSPAPSPSPGPAPAPAPRPAPASPAPGLHKFPDTKELGAHVGGGWRLIMSQEGSNNSIWDLERVKKCIGDGMADYDAKRGALVWRPRYYKDSRGRWDNWDGNPSSNVWKQFPRTALKDGVCVRMRFSSKKDPSMPRVEYNDRWNGGKEEANNLRFVAGTGDFRVGLIQTNGKKDPGDWHVWQVRLYPYLHRDAKKHIGASDTSNSSYWYREKPGGKECLIDDYSQDHDRDGFKKLKHGGELKFGMGPHSPFDEPFDVEFTLKMTGARTVASTVKVHGDEVQLDKYEHKTSGFGDEFTHVDAVCWSFNNMRPYCDINLTCTGW